MKLKTWFIMSALAFSLVSAATTQGLPAQPGDCDPILLGVQDYDLAIQPNSVIQVYAKGIRTARKLLRLTSDQYVTLVQAEQIPPDVTLVLDEIPLHVDLPMVAGVLVGKPLSLEGTHIQVQAEKMGVPFVYVQGVFSNSAINTISQWAGYFTLEADEKVELRFSREAPPGYEIKKIKSALPANKNRNLMAVLLPIEAEKKSVEEIGSKFAALAKFPASLRFLIRPEIITVTSGLYEEFLDSAVFEGQNLRKFIRTRMQLIEQPAQNDEVVKLALSEIRVAIESGKIARLFEGIVKAARLRGLDLMDQVSVRSNNEVEDLIGSGVFGSAVAESATAEHLGKAIKKVWATMFTYRSYSIRRFWGLREENLSMPILLHKYIGQEKVNGTGRFTFDGESLELHLSLVYGDQTKATNPSAGFKVQQLVVGKSEGELQVLEGPLNLDEGVLRSVTAMYEDLEIAVMHDFLKLRYQPQAVEIEFLIAANNRPILLQYKRRLFRETVLSLLKGEIKLNELERTVEEAASSNDAAIEMALNRNGVVMLHDFDFKNLTPRDGLRYALVAINGRYNVIFWENRLHSALQIQTKQISSEIVWITGGSLNLIETGKLLLGRSGGAYHAPDPEKLKIAIQNALVRNPTLLNKMTSLWIEATLPSNSAEVINFPLQAIPQTTPATEKNRSLFDLFKGG